MVKFAKLFPKRWRWAIIEYGALSLLLALALIASASWFFFLRFSPHSHDGYHRHLVVETQEATSDSSGFKLRIFFRDPNEELRYVFTRSIAMASQIVDEVCVEYRLQENGAHQYRFAPLAKCDG